MKCPQDAKLTNMKSSFILDLKCKLVLVVDVFEVSTELASHHYWNSLPESPYKRPYTLEERG